MDARSGPIDLTPLDCWREVEPNAVYRYRGLLIVGDADGGGATVGDIDRPDDEIGWGCDMRSAMEVANEHVDGFERVRRAA